MKPSFLSRKYNLTEKCAIGVLEVVWPKGSLLRRKEIDWEEKMGKELKHGGGA